MLNFKPQFPYINLLRALAITGVIVLHTFDNLYINTLFRFSVPMYVMLSGALLLSFPITSIKEFYKKRLIRLGIPLIIWSIIFIIITRLADPTVSIKLQFIRLVIFAQPFYLLFVLLGLYFITPFIQIIIHNTSNKIHLLLAVSSLLLAILVNFLQIKYLGSSVNLAIFSFTYFLYYIGYYLFGYYLHATKTHLNTLVVISITLLAYIAGVILNAYYLTLPIAIYTLCIFYLAKKLPYQSNKFIDSLSKYSYFIYFYHMLFLIIIKLFTSLPALPLFILTFTSSYLTAYIANRIPTINKALGL